MLGIESGPLQKLPVLLTAQPASLQPQLSKI